MEKGEVACTSNFSFSHYFPTLPKTNFNFLVTFILSSANAFNLDQPKILSFCRVKLDDCAFCCLIQKVILNFLKANCFITLLLYNFSSSRSITIFLICSQWIVVDWHEPTIFKKLSRVAFPTALDLHLLRHA